MPDPNFHKNLQHQGNICDPYICLFDCDCRPDDEQNNTFEILHVFLLSNVFYHLQRALTLQQRTLNDLWELIHHQYHVVSCYNHFFASFVI